MELVLIGLLVGAVLGFGFATVIYERAEATEFGKELQAMRRVSGAMYNDPTELDDVRIVYRGIPTDDGGSDLL